MLRYSSRENSNLVTLLAILSSTKNDDDGRVIGLKKKEAPLVLSDEDTNERSTRISIYVLFFTFLQSSLYDIKLP